MTTMLFSHPLCAAHKVPAHLPEHAARLAAIFRALDAPSFARLERRQPAPATLEDIALAHSPAHIEKVMALIPTEGYWALDDDTIVSPQSGEAALAAAGCVLAAVEAVMGGAARNAFCAVRPPGHHAGREIVGGFCLFNNLAIGALAAQARFGVKRVAIVDFDVHHGNGTQDIFWNNPDVFFASLHQQGIFPGSGAASETGVCDNVLNLPLPSGATGTLLRGVFAERVLPRLAAFKPELIMVSAGFDGHRDDPLAGWQLAEEDDGWLATALVKAAQDSCSGRLVAILEGGYNLEALGASVAAFMKPMLDEDAE